MKTFEKKYYRQVKKKIPNTIKKKNKLLKILRYSLSTYSQYHTTAAYSDYIKNFGNPKEYADILLEDSGLDNLSQSLRSQNKIITILCIGPVIIFLSIYLCAHVIRSHN